MGRGSNRELLLGKRKSVRQTAFSSPGLLLEAIESDDINGFYELLDSSTRGVQTDLLESDDVFYSLVQYYGDRIGATTGEQIAEVKEAVQQTFKKRGSDDPEYRLNPLHILLGSRLYGETEIAPMIEKELKEDLRGEKLLPVIKEYGDDDHMNVLAGLVVADMLEKNEVKLSAVSGPEKYVAKIFGAETTPVDPEWVADRMRNDFVSGKDIEDSLDERIVGYASRKVFDQIIQKAFRVAPGYDIHKVVANASLKKFFNSRSAIKRLKPIFKSENSMTAYKAASDSKTDRPLYLVKNLAVASQEFTARYMISGERDLSNRISNLMESPTSKSSLYLESYGLFSATPKKPHRGSLRDDIQLGTGYY